MASKADVHALCQQAGQCVEAEIDFVDETFTKLRRRKARFLREDFCGTAPTSGSWTTSGSGCVRVRAAAVTLPESREILEEAGFRGVTVYRLRARGLEAAPAGPISPPGKTGEEPRVRGVG